MLTLIVALSVAAPGDLPAGPLRSTEMVGSVGFLSTGIAFEQGAQRDGFLTLAADGRWVRGGFLAEGGLVAALPSGAFGPQGGVSATLRLGATGSRVAGSLGLLAQFTGGPAPFSPLPSLSAAVRVGPTIASLGVFDRFALVPARLSFEWNGIGVSYLALLGGEVFYRHALSPGLGLEAHLLAFSLFRTTTAMATVGIFWGAAR